MHFLFPETISNLTTFLYYNTPPQSRMVRNEDANFTWSLKRDPDEIKRLKPSHTVNHYGSAGSFTTKVSGFK